MPGAGDALMQDTAASKTSLQPLRYRKVRWTIKRPRKCQAVGKAMFWNSRTGILKDRNLLWGLWECLFASCLGSYDEKLKTSLNPLRMVPHGI